MYDEKIISRLDMMRTTVIPPRIPSDINCALEVGEALLTYSKDNKDCTSLKLFHLVNRLLKMALVTEITFAEFWSIRGENSLSENTRKIIHATLKRHQGIRGFNDTAHYRSVIGPAIIGAIDNVFQHFPSLEEGISFFEDYL